jgi:adenylate kinase family enzyme
MIKIIITGKSGSGKSTLAAKLRAQGLKQAKLHVLGPKREHHNEKEYI